MKTGSINQSMIGAYLYLPDNLDVNELMSNHPPKDFAFREGFDLLDMIFVISRLIEVPYLNRRARDTYGFVHLKAQYLQKVVPSYKDYLQYLCEAQIISINKHYIVGKKSRSYAFCEPYNSATGTKEVPVTITSRLYKRLAATANDLSISGNTKEQYPYITKWLNGFLTIDLKSANTVIKEIHNLRRLEKDELKASARNRFYDLLISPDIEELTKKEKGLYAKAIRPIYEYKLGVLTIHKQRWFAKVDETVHRYHTNITNLKSELRFCLRYKGKQLVCLDVKNCQPYLSILLFKPEFYSSENGKRATFHPSLQTPQSLQLSNFPSIHKSLTTHFTTPTITILLSEIMTEIAGTSEPTEKKSDIDLYIHHASRGTLYDYISKSLNERGLPVPSNKKDLKTMIFLTYFTSNKFKGQKEAEPKRFFAELFPTVSRIFELIKTPDKTNLPILLQQIESKLFLDCIARRISEERPDLPIYTVHDSIITLQGEENYVDSIIREECKKIIGVSPEVDVTHYDDQAVHTIITHLQSKIAKLKATT